MPVIDLANPSRFLALTDRILPWLAGAAAFAFAVGATQAYVAPDDYQQGATVKIMFIHVPAAWLGIFCWVLMSVAALGTLVWRHPLADVAAKAAAPIGAGVHADVPRHRHAVGPADVGHLLGVGRAADLGAGAVPDVSRRHRAVAHDRRASRAARVVAVLTLVGALNIPIIKFSVNWWNTLHQPAAVLKLGGPSIHPAILVPLLISIAAFTLLFLTLHLAAMRNEIMRRRVRTMLMMQAEARA